MKSQSGLTQHVKRCYEYEQLERRELRELRKERERRLRRDKSISLYPAVPRLRNKRTAGLIVYIDINTQRDDDDSRPPKKQRRSLSPPQPRDREVTSKPRRESGESSAGRNTSYVSSPLTEDDQANAHRREYIIDKRYIEPVPVEWSAAQAAEIFRESDDHNLESLADFLTKFTYTLNHTRRKLKSNKGLVYNLTQDLVLVRKGREFEYRGRLSSEKEVSCLQARYQVDLDLIRKTFEVSERKQSRSNKEKVSNLRDDLPRARQNHEVKQDRSRSQAQAMIDELVKRCDDQKEDHNNIRQTLESEVVSLKFQLRELEKAREGNCGRASSNGRSFCTENIKSQEGTYNAQSTKSASEKSQQSE
jgi:hypothetical protein